MIEILYNEKTKYQKDYARILYKAQFICTIHWNLRYKTSTIHIYIRKYIQILILILTTIMNDNLLN